MTSGAVSRGVGGVCGRAAASHDLAAKLGEWRFACIVGPLGNGKSSLARAGLVTDAAETAFPGIRSLKRVIQVPGGNLLRAFVEQLAAGLADAERSDRVAKAMEWIEPKARESSAEEWANRLNDEFRAWFPDSQQRLLFLVDQFEEVFTRRGLLTATDAEREGRIRKVLACLALLATLGEKRWHFVFTLRSDFYQRCRIAPCTSFGACGRVPVSPTRHPGRVFKQALTLFTADLQPPTSSQV